MLGIKLIKKLVNEDEHGKVFHVYAAGKNTSSHRVGILREYKKACPIWTPCDWHGEPMNESHGWS